jgi:Flp pilus assembly protein TadG
LYNLDTMNNVVVNKIRASGIKRNRRGAVLVETMFCLGFLLVMLFGIIQYSIILSTLNTLQQVSREGARFYCVHYADNTASNSLVDQTETVAYMQQVATTSGTFLKTTDITNSTVTIAPVAYGGNNVLAVDAPMSVTIQYDMSKRTFFGGFVPGVHKGTNLINETTVTLIEH